MTPAFVAQTTQACQPRLTVARTRVLGAPRAAHCGPAVAGKQPRRAPLANKARWASSLSLSRPQQLQATFFARQRQARARAPAANNNNGLQVRCDLAPGMINREVLMPTDRMKLDGTSDRGFYDYPRICYHVDDMFLSQLTELYRERIPENGVVLDLMSSWVSHLPPEKSYAKVVGHGMNAEELNKNPQLTEFFVRDLNADPGFAAEDETFDAVVCCVSVQYLQYPEKVFAEIFRVLKPGGVCIMSFSNRMFYQKAVAAWRDGTGFSRVSLVKQYFSCVVGFTEPEVVTEVGVAPDNSVLGKVKRLFKRSAGDPFYAVVAYRNFKAVHE